MPYFKPFLFSFFFSQQSTLIIMEELTTETEVKLIFSSSFKVAIGHIEYCPLVAALIKK